jgi:hypothetical protein
LREQVSACATWQQLVAWLQQMAAEGQLSQLAAAALKPAAAGGGAEA